MTYRQLLYKAQRLLNHNEITLGEYVEMTKPLDEEVRKQSEWYLRGGKFTCKNCEERALLKLTDATGGCREYNYYTSKFCPNCGCRMTKED